MASQFYNYSLESDLKNNPVVKETVLTTTNAAGHHTCLGMFFERTIACTVTKYFWTFSKSRPFCSVISPELDDFILKCLTPSLTRPFFSSSSGTFPGITKYSTRALTPVSASTVFTVATDVPTGVN